MLGALSISREVPVPENCHTADWPWSFATTAFRDGPIPPSPQSASSLPIVSHSPQGARPISSTPRGPRPQSRTILVVVTSGVNFTQNQRIEFRGYFESASLRHSSARGALLCLSSPRRLTPWPSRALVLTGRRGSVQRGNRRRGRSDGAPETRSPGGTARSVEPDGRRRPASPAPRLFQPPTCRSAGVAFFVFSLAGYCSTKTGCEPATAKLGSVCPRPLRVSSELDHASTRSFVAVNGQASRTDKYGDPPCQITGERRSHRHRSPQRQIRGKHRKTAWKNTIAPPDRAP